MRRRFAVAALICTVSGALGAEAVRVFAVSQRGRSFSVPEITIGRGDAIRFTNEDGFLHQLFVQSPTFNVDSDEQRPGEDVVVQFPVAGQFRVLCAIHPKMALAVTVR